MWRRLTGVAVATFVTTACSSGGGGDDTDDADDGAVNSAPTITVASRTTVDEHQVWVLQVQADDADPGDRITLRIAGGADAEAFRLTEGGDLFFVQAPDFEVPVDADGDNRYHLTVAASDGESETSVAIEVQVSDVDEAPEFSMPESLRHDENQLVVGTITASDPEGAELTFSIDGDDAGHFTIDADGMLSFAMAPNYEKPRDADGDNRYQIVIAVSDGSLQSSRPLTVTVADVQEPPVYTGPDAFTVDENQVAVGRLSGESADIGGEISYSLIGGDDRDRFALDGVTGELVFSMAPDYEQPRDADGDNRYQIVIAVSDGSLQSSRPLVVIVEDVPELLEYTGPDAFTVDENQIAVGSLSAESAEVGSEISFSLIGGDDRDRFALDGVTGALVFASAPDYEQPSDADGDNRYQIVIAVSDGVQQSSHPLTVTVADVPEPPVYTGPEAFTVDENQVAVGSLSFEDPDAGDEVFFSLIGGDDRDHFALDAVTGELVFSSAPDYEQASDTDGDNRYQVLVAIDDGTHVIEQALTVTVADVNEAPTLTAPAGIMHLENRLLVATLTASDPEGDDLAFAIAGGEDAAIFSIDATGSLAFASAPDYEQPTDADGDNHYQLSVSVSDGTFEDVAAIIVQVIDEAEYFSPATVRIPAGRFLQGDAGFLGDHDERPLRQVDISQAFEMAKTEVSNAQYAAMLNWALEAGFVELDDPVAPVSVRSAAADPVHGTVWSQRELLDLDHPGEVCQIVWESGTFALRDVGGHADGDSDSRGSHPVVAVTWHGALFFCWAQNRHEATGHQPVDLSDWSVDPTQPGWRLPTEAEWEYAARGGAAEARYPWWTDEAASRTAPDGSQANAFGDGDVYEGRYDGRGYPFSAGGGSYPANAYGLHDMAGNVWEWCLDVYVPEAYGAGEAVVDPVVQAAVGERVLRGGGWDDTGISLRCANRHRLAADLGRYEIGFRPCR